MFKYNKTNNPYVRGNVIQSEKKSRENSFDSFLKAMKLSVSDFNLENYFEHRYSKIRIEYINEFSGCKTG